VTGGAKDAATAKPTVAITGATGFVGQAVLNMAVRQGYGVRALTRRPQTPRDDVVWIEGTLNDQDNMQQLCSGADAVIHIAGVVNAPNRDDFENGNILGTLSAVQAAKTSGVERFVHVSSLAATRPDLSVYGETKAKAEKIIGTSGLDWTIVRPPAVYGPQDRDMLDLFKMAKWGFVLLPPDIEARLSIIHVEDLARLLLALLPSHEDLTTAIFEADDGHEERHPQLASERGWSHRSFAKSIGWAMDKRITAIGIARPILGMAAKLDRLIRRDRAKLTKDRVRYFCHDDWRIDPAKRPPEQLWVPEVKSREGLKGTINWYRQNGWL